MTLSTTIASEPIPYIEHDTLESLLQNQERLEAEFAAIMTVSGFGDRIVVTTLTPLKPELVSRGRKRDRIFRAATRALAMRRDARVRSPPDWP